MRWLIRKINQLWNWISEGEAPTAYDDYMDFGIGMGNRAKSWVMMVVLFILIIPTIFLVIWIDSLFH